MAKVAFEVGSGVTDLMTSIPYIVSPTSFPNLLRTRLPLLEDASGRKMANKFSDVYGRVVVDIKQPRYGVFAWLLAAGQSGIIHFPKGEHDRGSLLSYANCVNVVARFTCGVVDSKWYHNFIIAIAISRLHHIKLCHPSSCNPLIISSTPCLCISCSSSSTS